MLHTVSTELKSKVNQTIEETVTTIETQYGIKFPKITVKYDIDSARIGGQAIPRYNTVRFNPAFLNKYQDEYINTTVVHEVVHLGVSIKFPFAQSHGREWKQMMVVCGAKPNRCHSYEADSGQGRQKTKYVYVCDRCGANIITGPVVHRNQQEGAGYVHKRCGGKLTFSQSAGKVSYQEAKKQPINEQPTQPKQPTTNSKPISLPSPQSKMGKCYNLYTQLKDQYTRKLMIARFINEGCTPAGAATYYANCVKLYNQTH